MAKNNDKRAERIARSNRNVNRAIILLMVGVIAEFYLLMVNNYFVKGGVGQVLTMMSVLKALGIIGAAAFGAGLVMWIMRKKWTRFAPAAPWLLCAGFFFAMSSELMLRIYPQGTTMMCVIVPVAMLIGIVFLLYPREFSVQAVGLTASLMAMYLIHHGSGSEMWSALVIGCSVFAVAVIAALAVAVYKAGKNGGKLEKLGDLRIARGGRVSQGSLMVGFGHARIGCALVGKTRKLRLELCDFGVFARGNFGECRNLLGLCRTGSRVVFPFDRGEALGEFRDFRIAGSDLVARLPAHLLARKRHRLLTLFGEKFLATLDFPIELRVAHLLHDVRKARLVHLKHRPTMRTLNLVHRNLPVASCAACISLALAVSLQIPNLQASLDKVLAIMSVS